MVPNNTSCPKCHSAASGGEINTNVYLGKCGAVFNAESGECSQTFDCVSRQLATERARLAQVKALVPRDRAITVSEKAGLLCLLSDTPEVLAVVEGFMMPSAVYTAVDGSRGFTVNHHSTNSQELPVTATVTARTEGGE